MKDLSKVQFKKGAKRRGLLTCCFEQRGGHVSKAPPRYTTALYSFHHLSEYTFFCRRQIQKFRHEIMSNNIFIKYYFIFIKNKTVFQLDAYRPLENHTCFSFCCHHQMSLWGKEQVPKRVSLNKSSVLITRCH